MARLVPVQPPQPTPFTLRADASYLVTGGLKGLGYEVARWLPQHGAQNLILLGRTPPSESPLLVNRIRELEEVGISVHYGAVDVADTRQMAAFFKALAQTSQPPIRGVVHCASVWQDNNGNSWVRPLVQLDQAALSAVLQPKVLGTLLLAQQLAETSLDFFTLFSSGTTLMGSAAQSNYTAANTFLDAYAHHLVASGEPATSINWGPVSEVGFGGTLEGQKVHEYWESQGIGRISPAHVLAALERLHANNVPQIAVMNMDWARLLQAHPDLAGMAWASDLLKGDQPTKEAQTSDLPHARRLPASWPSESTTEALKEAPETLFSSQSSSTTATSASHISQKEE